MHNRTILILFTIVGLALSGCTITHKFGPFSGKVVDAKTGEPIEGAVVLIGFHTMSFSLGGWSWHFADAIETFTDDKGEFSFPPKRVNLIRFMSFWDKECKISILKPGYGAYPGHPKTFSVPKLETKRIVPENQYLIYHIPILLTAKERKENLWKIETPGGIDINKMPNFNRLKNEEYTNAYGF
jgi:hypothetical protein